ncbi:MAG TPA: pilus assembly protein TadG-related protein [Sphingomonas sp.]|nr:pilus assembly protein TadG-related protein [Sphingomonas sp.]
MPTLNTCRRRRLWRDRAGSVLAITAAALPLLIGAAGLAVDTVQWTYWRRQLQREADSAALAGAFAKAQGRDAVVAASSELLRTNVILLASSPDIRSAPTVGAFAGNSQAVRVSIQTSRRLPFSGTFMSAAPVISAQATAAVLSNGTYCALALGSSSAVGIKMQGSASLDFGCGLATNSRAANAVTAGGSASITATPVAAVGGLSASNNYTGETRLLPYSLPQPDPYGQLANPVLPGCSGPVNVGPHGDQTLTSGGCYRGMDIKGTLRLAAGTYYIDGSSFSVGSQGTIIGDNVTIILTSSTAATDPSSIATLNINAGATVQLTAPTTGIYNGILFYQDRRALDSGTNQINGNATSSLHGAFYFPSQELAFSGTSGMTADCLQLVAIRLTFVGNTSVSNHCDVGGGSAFTGVQVRLVE